MVLVFALSLMPFLSAVDGEVGLAQSPPLAVTCAVVFDREADAAVAPLAHLLEERLGREGSLTLVDRSAFEAVIREQKLGLVFEAGDLSSRRSLGKLLKADLLLFPRLIQYEDKRGVELSVVSSESGLRLARYVALDEPTKYESMVDAMAKVVTEASAKANRDDLLIFAVPPFLSEDLGFANLHLRGAFATIIERSLEKNSNAVTVELLEAEALKREVLLSPDASQMARRLPYYVEGSFRHSGQGAGKTVSFRLELSRGEAELATANREGVRGADTRRALESCLEEILADVAVEVLPTVDPAVEAQRLAARAEVFEALGQVDEAGPMYESVLLLDKLNISAHRGLFRLSAAFMPSGGRTEFKPGELTFYPKGRLRALEAALDHVEVILNQDVVDQSFVHDLSLFVGYVNLIGYDREADPLQINRDLERLLSRYIGAVLERLSTASYASPLTPRMRGALRGYITTATLTLGMTDFDRATEFILAILEDSGSTYKEYIEQSNTLYHVAGRRWTTWNRIPRKSLEGLINRLSTLDIETAPLLADTFAAFLSIEDENSYRRACTSFDALLARYPAALPSRASLMFRAEIILRAALANNFERSVQVSIPILRNLSKDIVYPFGTNGRARQPGRISDWVSAGDAVDVVIADQKAFALFEPPNLVPLGETQVMWLEWDGKYVWAVTRQFGIQVFEIGRGEIAGLDASNLPAGGGAINVILPVSPGHVVAIGVQRAGAHPNTWVAELTVADRIDSEPTITVEPVWEGRRSNRAEDAAVNTSTSFFPDWAFLQPDEPDRASSGILIGRRRHPPLWIDLQTNEASVYAHEWPWHPTVVAGDNSAFIISAKASMNLQSTHVYKWSGIEKPLVHIMSTEEHMISSKARAYHQNYGIGTVQGSYLHLIANRDALEPRWVALDLDSLKMYEMDSEFKSRSDWPRFFSRSNHFGLILLQDRTAYQVKLPDPSTWPLYDPGPVPLDKR